MKHHTKNIDEWDHCTVDATPWDAYFLANHIHQPITSPIPSLSSIGRGLDRPVLRMCNSNNGKYHFNTVFIKGSKILLLFSGFFMTEKYSEKAAIPMFLLMWMLNIWTFQGYSARITKHPPIQVGSENLGALEPFYIVGLTLIRCKLWTSRAPALTLYQIDRHMNEHPRTNPGTRGPWILVNVSIIRPLW